MWATYYPYRVLQGPRICILSGPTFRGVQADKDAMKHFQVPKQFADKAQAPAGSSGTRTRANSERVRLEQCRVKSVGVTQITPAKLLT